MKQVANESRIRRVVRSFSRIFDLFFFFFVRRSA
jgi:hypothetical protein